MTARNDLENNQTDNALLLTKAMLGVLPGGSLVAEIVGNLIPEQRLDRIVKYCIELEERLQRIDQDVLNEKLKNEKFIDLVEEGFIQASRALSDERRKYIASIIENGVSEEFSDLEDSKYMLRLLEQINDAEIIWLKYYEIYGIENTNAFVEKHHSILGTTPYTDDGDFKAANKMAIRESYKGHLEQLKLIEIKVKFDKKLGSPVYNNITGKPKLGAPQVKPLGRLLLKQIGILTGPD